MNMYPQASRVSQDSIILSAWREQIAQAVRTPGLPHILARQEQALLPRFAGYYLKLYSLPRKMRRGLQRQWKQSLAGLALLLTLGQAPALAATINVGAGGCTLVDAITAANTNAAVGSCPAGSGPDTLVLPTGSTHTLTSINNSTFGATGLPVIRSRITIQGNNSTIRRTSGAPEFRIFAANGSGNLTLQQTTVNGGSTYNVFPYASGGGIANYGGIVTLTNSTVSGNNTAPFGTGGGGVFNNNGTLTLTNSKVSGNSSRYGGGILNVGIMTLAGSTVSGNFGYFGGGIYNFNGTLKLTDSTVSGNRVFFWRHWRRRPRRRHKQRWHPDPC